MSPELKVLKNINELNTIIIEKSNLFTIGLILLRMNLLLKETKLKDI